MKSVSYRCNHCNAQIVNYRGVPLGVVEWIDARPQEMHFCNWSHLEAFALHRQTNSYQGLPVARNSNSNSPPGE